MSTSVDYNVFTQITDNGNSSAFDLPGDINEVKIYLNEGAGYDSGTLKMQSSVDGGTTWVDVPSASFTSGDGALGTFTVFGRQIRFNAASVAGASATLTPAVVVKAKSMTKLVAKASITDNETSDTYNFGRKPGAMALFAAGTWDSGDMLAQFSVDGGTTWYDTGCALSADGGSIVADMSDIDSATFRVKVQNVATSSADLDWYLLATE